MREWLSGGAPPCQGGGRGFDPRLALFNAKKQHPKRVLFFRLNEPNPGLEGSEVSPAGSVVAPAKQGHPQDDRNPSRAFHKKRI